MPAAAWLWLLSGPNGSGKSALARSRALERLDPAIPGIAQSPDDIARLLRGLYPEAGERARVRAAQAASDTLVEIAVEDGRTLMVETVGSSDKFFGLVASAKARGCRIGLIYVVVADVALNLARVEQRHADGGHDVPEEAVRRRRADSIARLPRFAALADRGLVVDNTETAASTRHPRPRLRLLAERRPGHPWRVLDAAPDIPDLAPALAALRAV